MEAATAIMYGENSVTGERSVRWRNVVIHEVAHQWFGISLREGAQSFEIPLPTEPRDAELDPGTWLLFQADFGDPRGSG